MSARLPLRAHLAARGRKASPPPAAPETAPEPEPASGRRARPTPRGVLMLLAAMLALSAATRVGFGPGLAPVRAAMAEGAVATGQALAAAPEALLADRASEPGEAATPAAAPAAAAVSGEDAVGIEALIAALAEREAALDAREAALAERMTEAEEGQAAREAELAATKGEVEGMLGDLEEAEARLDAAIARASGAAEDDLARLTAVYESMKPKEAAALFETMEPGFSAGFLGRMRPEAAAEIMAGLSPERAYAVSAIIAGRNARLDDGAGAGAAGEGAP